MFIICTNYMNNISSVIFLAEIGKGRPKQKNIWKRLFVFDQIHM